MKLPARNSASPPHKTRWLGALLFVSASGLLSVALPGSISLTRAAAATVADAAHQAEAAVQQAEDDGESTDDADSPDDPNDADAISRLAAPQRATIDHTTKPDGSHRSEHDMTGIGHDSVLPAGQQAGNVVSIAGSAVSDGEADQVVSVFGSTKVSGTVHDAAVAVFGNVYVDGKVEGDAVAVFGNVELGPHADVEGDVNAIFGTVHRDPSAAIRGDINDVVDVDLGDHAAARAWIKHCLFYARPLALAPGLTAAWICAGAFLSLYVLLAALSASSIRRCVDTLRREPGHTAVVAVLGILVTPMLLALMCITIIGIAALPLIAAVLFGVVLFGKAVVLAWIGERIIGRREGSTAGLIAAVLVGGVIVTLLYLIPVVGLLVFKLLGIAGFGAVVHTLLLSLRARQAARPTAPSATPDPAAATTATDTVSATVTATTATAAPIAPYAGFWIRMAALSIDVLLIGVAFALLHPLVHFHLLLLAIYGAIMWKMRGTTVGGIVFDLKVVRVDGRELGWETAIVRALGCFLSLAIAGLGFFWIAFDEVHQAWHDKIAGTVVVRAPKTAAAMV